MIRSIFSATMAIAVISTSSITAMPMTDGDLTLAPPPPPKPKVLDIAFGATPKEIVSLMQIQKISLHDQIEPDSHGVSKLLTFGGVPRGVTVRNGTSQFLFFKNELIRMTFEFSPSYSNFLELRNQLLSSLGDRFTIADQKESMDTHLRMRLSSLDHSSFKQDSEKLINSSITEGKTFFYYRIKDRTDTLVITLAYMYDHDSSDGRPALSLHYDHNPGLRDFEAFEEEYNCNSPGAAGGTTQPLTPQ